jgi:hypothetical protein
MVKLLLKNYRSIEFFYCFQGFFCVYVCSNWKKTGRKIKNGFQNFSSFVEHFTENRASRAPKSGGEFGE